MKSKSKQKGFTLFELLVVVLVIGLVSSILIANLRKGEKQYQIQLAAQEIAQNIRRAQDMALTSWRHQGEIPYNYGVYFRKQDKDSYKIFADKNGNNKYETSDGLVETVKIESNIEIDSLSSEPDLYITFSLPDGFTHIEPLASSATITIRRVNGICPQNCKSIKIINTGQINIE